MSSTRSGPKLGLLFPYREGLITSPSFLRSFLATAESVGVESVWAVEHVVVADAYEPRYPYSPDGRMPSGPGVVPMPDPLELLAFAAAVTTRINLGTAVVVAPLHSPAVLAKRAATLDRLSEGRFRLGLGIGWQVEEYAAVGAAFDHRGDRLEDGIAAMRALWAEAPASYQGAFTAFERVHLAPRPVADAIPVVLGGNSAPAIERAGRVADGWFPYTISPEEFAAGVAAVRTAAREAGRREDAVETTVWPGSYDPARREDALLACAYLAAGADRLVLRPKLSGDNPFETLSRQVSRYLADIEAVRG
jgi:probable F420-dependent oxidoreductase